MKRTRLSICERKARYASAAAALAFAVEVGLGLRAYRCDRCWQYHLTSRMKGGRAVHPVRPMIDRRFGPDDPR